MCLISPPLSLCLEIQNIQSEEESRLGYWIEIERNKRATSDFGLLNNLIALFVFLLNKASIYSIIRLARNE